MLGTRFEVGTQFAIYDRDGDLVRRVPVDVESGQFLEPLELANGETLWMALPGGGHLLPLFRSR